MLKGEYDSQDGEVYKTLKTAKEYGYQNKPCDICKKIDKEVRFWGGSSVLTCGRYACLEEMENRWAEAMARNSNNDDDY